MPNAPVALIGTDQTFFSVATFELLIGPGTLRVFCRSAPGSGHSPAVAAPGFALLPEATLTPGTATALTAATTATLVANSLRRLRFDVTWGSPSHTISPPRKVCGGNAITVKLL